LRRRVYDDVCCLSKTLFGKQSAAKLVPRSSAIQKIAHTTSVWIAPFALAYLRTRKECGKRRVLKASALAGISEITCSRSS
jgi:hypothetical protein